MRLNRKKLQNKKNIYFSESTKKEYKFTLSFKIKHMKNSEFIKLVQDRYKWILCFAFVAFVAAAVYYFQFAKRYEAEVTIMIPSSSGSSPDKGATEAERYAFAIQNAMTAARLKNFIYSDVMVKHLAEKFDLLFHYEIEKSNPYSWNILMKNFQDNLKVQQVGDEMVEITFSDYNEVVAADVANEIVAKLIVMNKEYVVNSIRQRRDLFAGVVGELNIQVGDQLSHLEAMMSDFKEGSHLSEKNLNKLDFNFANAMSDISRLTNDLIRTQQFYKWSQIAIESNFQNNIFLVNSAYPNKPPLSYLKMIGVGLCAAVVAISAGCVLIYLYFSLRSRINDMLTEV